MNPTAQKNAHAKRHGDRKERACHRADEEKGLCSDEREAILRCVPTLHKHNFEYYPSSIIRRLDEGS
jgi:hypothetical protein